MVRGKHITGEKGCQSEMRRGIVGAGEDISQ